MLPMEQIQAAEHGLDPTNSGGARGLKRSAQWPGGVVPFTLHSSASMILVLYHKISHESLVFSRCREEPLGAFAYKGNK